MVIAFSQSWLPNTETVFPHYIRNSAFMDIFKKFLKTYLFNQTKRLCFIICSTLELLGIWPHYKYAFIILFIIIYFCTVWNHPSCEPVPLHLMARPWCAHHTNSPAQPEGAGGAARWGQWQAHTGALQVNVDMSILRGFQT